MIHEIINSRIFLLTLTVGVYYGAMALYKKFRHPLLNPLLISVIVVIGIIYLLDIDYERYYEANSIINFFLGMSVVALGYLLHQNITHIRGKALAILASTFAGSLVAILSVIGVAHLLGADKIVIASIQAKSTTMPIAVVIAENSGGIPALTSMAVIFAGIFGGVAGPWLLRIFGIKDSVARGLALGSASHAVGTAKAMEMGAVEGAVGGAAIGLMGVMTAVLVPIIEKIIW